MNGKLDNLDSENLRERKSASRLIGKIGGWATLAAALIAAGLAVYISVCSARGVPAKLFGRSFARVMTGSMSPSISEGDYIIIKSGDLNELKKGDIITFYSEDPTIYGKLNTHRIIGVAENGSYITKGDANTEADPVTVKRSKIVGKYAGKSRFLRWVNSFASGKKLIMIAAVIPMLGVAIYEAATIGRITRESREERERAAAEEREKLLREAIDEEKRKLYEAANHEKENANTDNSDNANSEEAGE